MIGWRAGATLVASCWLTVCSLIAAFAEDGVASGATAGGGWVEVAREGFDALSFPEPPTWQPDDPAALQLELPEEIAPFADDGKLWAELPLFRLPSAHRISAPFGTDGFLTVESYSRQEKDPAQLFSAVDDPAVPGNKVLQLASPEHTDGTLIRTSQPLGTRYQICARIGYISFGTGDGKNGYSGGERNGPWLQESGDATGENGCYFGAIYRAIPRPHNNVLAHHLRVAFIDSDNNLGAWTVIWTPKPRRFLASGWHPVVMGVSDAYGVLTHPTDTPFLTYAAGVWNEPGEVRAVDAYKENAWYTVCITRFDDRLTLSISGDFRYGGQTTYEATFNEPSRIAYLNDPHYWCLGDPHINYYEGSLLVDDIVLKTWKE